MGAITSQITSLTVVFSTVYLDTDQRQHQSPASLAFAGNSPEAGEFPAQMASNAENVSIWWRHHVSDGIVNVAPKSFFISPYSTSVLNLNGWKTESNPAFDK